MKKYKILLNVLFICICVFSIVAFALSISPCQNQFEQYNTCKKTFYGFPEMLTPDNITYMNGFLSRAIQCIFIAIFTGLSSVASAVAAVSYNLPTLKAKRLSNTEKPKED